MGRCRGGGERPSETSLLGSQPPPQSPAVGPSAGVLPTMQRMRSRWLGCSPRRMHQGPSYPSSRSSSKPFKHDTCLVLSPRRRLGVTVTDGDSLRIHDVHDIIRGTVVRTNRCRQRRKRVAVRPSGRQVTSCRLLPPLAFGAPRRKRPTHPLSEVHRRRWVTPIHARPLSQGPQPPHRPGLVAVAGAQPSREVAAFLPGTCLVLECACAGFAHDMDLGDGDVAASAARTRLPGTLVLSCLCLRRHHCPPRPGGGITSRTAIASVHASSI